MNASQSELFGAKPVTAFGIDPGSVATGWGVIQRAGRQLLYVNSGVLRPAGRLDYRLAYIADRLTTLLDDHEPDVVGMEEQFVPREQKHFRGALVVSAARGAAATAVGSFELHLGSQLRFKELPPATIKKAVACSGRAKKEEVQQAVRRILGLPTRPMGNDESDALAAAICAALWAGRRQ